MTALSHSHHFVMLIFTAFFLVGTMAGLLFTMSRLARRIG
jgi:hypothetical protein